jgi:hypothetical protein
VRYAPLRTCHVRCCLGSSRCLTTCYSEGVVDSDMMNETTLESMVIHMMEQKFLPCSFVEFDKFQISGIVCNLMHVEEKASGQLGALTIGSKEFQLPLRDPTEEESRGLK